MIFPNLLHLLSSDRSKDKLAQEDVQLCQVSIDVEQLPSRTFTLAWQRQRENASLCVGVCVCVYNTFVFTYFSGCSNIPLQGIFPPFSFSLSMQEHEKHFIFPLLIAFQISMHWLEVSKIFR